MPVMPLQRQACMRLRASDGFTMVVALGVMFVTSVLLAAAFAVANGDIRLSHDDANQKQAYYAALAGIQAYEQKLEANPDYWETCEAPTTTLLEEAAGEHYEVKVLPASSAPKGTTTCSAANPFATVIESEGALANTFRIKSTGYTKTTGYAASAKRSVIATFKVTGFLDYLYYTNFEQGDPQVFGTPSECEGKYYSEWQGKYRCNEITFVGGDEVKGPMHTNDAARIEGEAKFGRNGHTPADVVEINGGTYPHEGCGEGTSAKYYTATGCFTKGATLLPPAEDTTLEAYVNKEKDMFEGQTHLELKGSTNKIAVSNYKEGKEVKTEIEWPSNGLIYVKQTSSGCNYTYQVESADTTSANESEKNCGNVFVNGTYSKSLTIAGEGEVIVNGSVYPTSVEGKLPETTTSSSKPPVPSGTAVLGLIATKYVRLYHPCEAEVNGPGKLENPWIYAAILSTSHSFIVDNYGCGAGLGQLHVYGAIAQDYRGTVGTKAGTGYIKDYNYDDRLAAAEPPYFLAPLKAGWKVERQTAAEAG
jgi:Tfp pilus assembly protein PilX